MIELLRAWRASRTLDDRAGGSCDRPQSLVHALLSDPASAPREQPPAFLGRRVAVRIENGRIARLESGADHGSPSAPFLRARARWEIPLAASVLVLGIAGVWAVRAMHGRGYVPFMGPSEQVAHARASKALWHDTDLSDGIETPTRTRYFSRVTPPAAREAQELAQQARAVRDAMISMLPLRPAADDK